MKQRPIVLEYSRKRAQQLIALLDAFAQNCALHRGEGQDPDEQKRLQRRQHEADWWAIQVRVALAIALPRRRKTHAR